MSDPEDWKLSGKIAREALLYGIELCKPDKKHIDIVDAIEKKIIKLGGFPAFPVDLSIDSMAAHQTPNVGDEKILHKGEVVKVDVGVHVNGCVTDNAATVILGHEWKDMKKAVEDALQAAIEQAVPGNKIRHIGKAVAETIQSRGFNSITNLSGHGVGKWIVHDDPTIPNYDNGDNTLLKQGQKIAIEPFATNGDGAIRDGKPCGVYRILQSKPVRLDSVRKVLAFIEKNYLTLPFSPRWLSHLPNYQFAVRILEQEGVLKQYAELLERSGGMVTQAEKTVSVGESVLT